MSRLIKSISELKENEKLLLSAIQHSADRSISEIAAEIGLEQSAARYALKNLKAHSIITAALPFVNLCKLGYTYYSVLFTLGEGNTKNREKLLEMIQRHPRVTWFGEFSGGYRYGITLVAETPRDVARTLEQFKAKSGATIVAKEVVPKLAKNFYPRRYLHTHSPIQLEIFRYENETASVAIDETDHLLLKQISEEETLSSRRLSSLVGIPESTIRLRLDKLKEYGVISGEYFRINTGVLGIRSSVILIYTRGLEPSAVKQLEAYCESSSHITFLVETLGAWDFEIGVESIESTAVTRTFDELQDLIGWSVERLQPLEIVKELRQDPYPLLEMPD